MTHMRVLFIENRYATMLWQQAANALAAHGCEISWMVQNHSFAPIAPRVHRLAYPRREDLDETPLDEELQAIARTDRALNYFGLRPTHYRYYLRLVDQLIDAVAPDLVFGEATQFHELMVIARCKAFGIPYLVPTATRYPAGRLTFLLHDSFESIGGCSFSPSETETDRLIDDVVHRRVIPSYMEPQHQSWLATLARRREQLRIAASWASGERYITPAPWRRLALDRAQREARARWDRLALHRGGMTRLPAHAHWVLYPLQLQPESNLDVFGQPWISQTSTMEKAARALAARNATLVVKPNPKSKYEMTSKLVDVAAANDNIVVLPHDCPIGPVFQSAPLLLSVTGTVILESIFQAKPVAVLGSHGMASLPGVMPLKQPEQVAGLLAEVDHGTARTASRDEARSVFRELFRTSYDALLWDPIARPDLFRVDLITRLQAAFIDVVKHIPPTRWAAKAP
jgi:Capsule polysaccharide biosynthesis protein